jgi:hypothetical protein
LSIHLLSDGIKSAEEITPFGLDVCQEKLVKWQPAQIKIIALYPSQKRVLTVKRVNKDQGKGILI